MLKENIYDSFRCLADKCEMTCCKGWAIRVENADIDKWKEKEETKYICEYIKPRNDSYVMKINNDTSCTFFDDCGLCELVKKHGEEVLSKTCSDFPRKHNTVEEFIDEETRGDVLLEEYSLSGACPGVIELIRLNKGRIIDLPDKCRDNKVFPFEYQIRNMVIDIFQETDYSLIEKSMLAFSFLHECLECEWEEDIYSLIETYRLPENQKEQLTNLEKLSVDRREGLIEIGQTFLDMTEFYKEEEMYKPYLSKLYNYCENLDKNIEENTKAWTKFTEAFCRYDGIIEKVIVGEVFADCISDDLGVIIESFQSIILEYCMTRMSVFLLNELGEKTDDKTVMTYLALFIRMIGHNVEGMCEYWEENFEDSILELEYIKILLT